eukprot:CAMPEP_0197035438 /NCGR_PEP_ID=MMETSP1384-20130603/13240_1 /TAXON_ID=29189 /ORGANISM="Ammonia sp." /LENGTH=287 /DNA_ID=CAMNT_0042465503 /DNA_START=93 /DNA_END=953 /DNA_ORIENTATION=-
MDVSCSWVDVDEDLIKFDMNKEYRIVKREINEFDEECLTTIYMNACTPYELYFNDAISQHVYACINVHDLHHYEYRLKGQRDCKYESVKYPIYRVQQSQRDTCTWKEWKGRHFNTQHEYILVVDEPDSRLSRKSRFFLVTGYLLRYASNLENRGLAAISSIVNAYYDNSGHLGYICMEQVVRKELYFSVSVQHHWYGCIASNASQSWHYRLKGNCVKRMNREQFRCYHIKYREQAEHDKYERVAEDITSFNHDWQYRIRLIRNGGYIVVERVSADKLIFGVSISEFW